MFGNTVCRLLKAGICFYTEYARYLARPGEPLRLGVTIPKRVGKAVTRNKLRRRIREHARLRQWDLREVDVVVDCRPGVGELSGPALLEELDGLWLEMRRRLA